MSKNEGKAAPSYINLPNEILLKIFSHLDTSTLARIQLVCKTWNVVSEDSSLWKSISVKGSRNICHLPKVISKYPKVRSLNIEKCILNSTVFKAITELRHLETLRIYECTFFLGSTNAFCSLMKTSPLLACLELKKCCIDSVVLDMISEARNLRCLKITYLERQNLSKILEKCELEELEIDKIDHLSEESIENIFKLCSDTLIGVVLHGERHLSDAIFSNIENCLQLSKFGVGRCNAMTDLSLILLENLTSLKFLELGYGTNFSQPGLLAFFERASLAKLVYLDLTRCANLDDTCVCLVAHKCKGLRSLCLKSCVKLTDKSAVQMVRKCTQLRILDLSWIESLRGSFFQELIVYSKNLKILDLRMCRGIEKSQIKMLIMSHPSLLVYKSGQ